MCKIYQRIRFIFKLFRFDIKEKQNHFRLTERLINSKFINYVSDTQPVSKNVLRNNELRNAKLVSPILIHFIFFWLGLRRPNRCNEDQHSKLLLLPKHRRWLTHLIFLVMISFAFKYKMLNNRIWNLMNIMGSLSSLYSFVYER